jgi:hemerythrin
MGISWRDDLASGVNEIDDQHKEIFSRINSLLDAARQGKGKEDVGKVISFLGEYVVMHFGIEENYMNKFDYPEMQTHKSLHRAFVDDFLVLKGGFEKDGATSPLLIQLQHRVCDWLLSHIGKTDKALGGYLKTRM